MQDVPIPVEGGEFNVWHRAAGSGESTIVLVHGLSGTSRWWVRVVDRLPPGPGLIALDLRGRGGSVSAPPPFDLATMADDIALAMSHLGVDRAVVSGYSMGAWIAALVGQRHPERVERLILLDGGLPIPFDPAADPDDVIDAVVGPSLARLDMEFETREAFLDYWRAHPALERHWEDGMIAALDYELGPAGRHFKVSANREAIRVSARQITVDPATNAAAARTGVRTHLIVVERGTADQPGGMIPVAVAEEAAAGNPLLTMEYLPGVNHYTLVLGSGVQAVASALTRR